MPGQAGGCEAKRRPEVTRGKLKVPQTVRPKSCAILSQRWSIVDPRAIEQLPLVWHPTTPRSFACQAGCICCCTSTLFLPEEAASLSEGEQSLLCNIDGLIRPQIRLPGVCAFFDGRLPNHCRIYPKRPLRCRLYPYLPVIEKLRRIVILAEPLCSVMWREDVTPEWFRCYGLGRGEDATDEVEAMSRGFLAGLATVYPRLVDAYLCVDDVEGLIDWNEVEKQRSPLYPEWETETIRRAALAWAGRREGADREERA